MTIERFQFSILVMKFQSRNTKFDAFFPVHVLMFRHVNFWCGYWLPLNFLPRPFVTSSLSIFALFFRTPTKWNISNWHKSHTFADKHNFDASLFLLSISFQKKASFCDSWMMAWLYMLLSHSPCRYILFGTSKYTNKICTHINTASGRFNLLKIFANLFFDVFTGAYRKKRFGVCFKVVVTLEKFSLKAFYPFVWLLLISFGCLI